MGHLSSNELVEAAEGGRSSLVRSHLDACEACRAKVVELQSVMASVEQLSVPEPSPLFWDHLSSRVHVAVAAASEPRRLGLLERFGFRDATTGWRSGGALTAVTASVLTVLVLTGWFMLLEPAGHDEVARSAGSGPTGTLAPDSIDVSADDPSLDLVAGLFNELDWDAVKESGLSAEVGTADGAVDRLTVNERRELDRLLKEAIANPGESETPAQRGRVG